MRFYHPFSPSDIKAVAFDLDDTLYDNEPIIERAVNGLADYLREHFPIAGQKSAAEWFAIKRRLCQQDHRLISDVSKLRYLSLLEGLQEDVPERLAREQAAQQCYDMFYHLRSDFSVDENVCSTLARLAKLRPIAAITNGNANLDQIGLGDTFSVVLHASSDNIRKPHRDMFDKCASQLGIRPSQILHVGDNMENDVLGGKRAGCKTAWLAVNRPMNLINEAVTCLPDLVLDDLSELESLFGR